MGEAKRRREAGEVLTPKWGKPRYGLAVGYGTGPGRVGEESCAIKAYVGKGPNTIYVEKCVIRAVSTEEFSGMIDEVVESRGDKVISDLLERGEIDQYKGFDREVFFDGVRLKPIAVAALLAALQDDIDGTAT